LAAAIIQLEKVGMQTVADHESQLTSYTLEQLAKFPEITVIGDMDPERAAERLGVIPFNLDGISHFLVAAILGHEYGIGVRSGCFCAHPYVLHLLRLSKDDAAEVRNQIIAGDRSNMPGMVRASFGLYNSEKDIDALIEALKQINQGEYKGNYVQDHQSGEFTPQGWNPDFNRYFSIPSLIE
jgi:selenocysteine lyase/cysteine desulfurase